MSYKTLLVHAEASDACEDGIRLAVDVAAMFSAKIIGLSTENIDLNRPEPHALAERATNDNEFKPNATNRPFTEQRFHELTKSVAAGAEWRVGREVPATALAHHACRADLIVASRPSRGSMAVFTAPGADLLLTAGAPVLFAGDGAAPLKADHVLVAWKNSKDARRALSDAMPLLVRAQTVTLASIIGDAGENSDFEQLAGLVERLVRHNVNVRALTLQQKRRPVAELLEQAAGRTTSDLIVMGARRRPDVGECVLGDTTEDMLAACSRHVLFGH